jgi:hypothetical protein
LNNLIRIIVQLLLRANTLGAAALAS